MSKHKKLFRSLTDDELDRVINATMMLEHSPVDQVAVYTGVQRKFLEAGADMIKHPEWLDDTGKPDLLPSKYYANIRSEVKRASVISVEDIEAKFQIALTERQFKCEHRQYFCRCTHCMKILGSEINHFSFETISKLVREVEFDLQEPHDEKGNELRREICLVIQDRLYKEVITRVEDEEFDSL